MLALDTPWAVCPPSQPVSFTSEEQYTDPFDPPWREPGCCTPLSMGAQCQGLTTGMRWRPASSGEAPPAPAPAIRLEPFATTMQAISDQFPEGVPEEEGLLSVAPMTTLGHCEVVAALLKAGAALTEQRSRRLQAWLHATLNIKALAEVRAMTCWASCTSMLRHSSCLSGNPLACMPGMCRMVRLLVTSLRFMALVGAS